VYEVLNRRLDGADRARHTVCLVRLPEAHNENHHAP
jgi:hypothetical protein